MTHKEKHKNELDKMLGLDIAVIDNRPLLCNDTDCCKCLFYNNCMTDLEHLEAFQKWLDSEYVEPLKIDWNKIPIDTRIELSNDGKYWWNRYFAGCSEFDNTPKVFAFGATSWSCDSNNRKEYVCVPIVRYVRFPDGEVEGIVELD